ncbi:MAG: hypothetical protein EOO41_03575 [Methanobacteriota archaeon]|nr:MAG: hypothetical protein EOO41_03575 [Euryarchaeota archaeon]
MLPLCAALFASIFLSSPLRSVPDAAAAGAAADASVARRQDSLVSTTSAPVQHASLDAHGAGCAREDSAAGDAHLDVDDLLVCPEAVVLLAHLALVFTCSMLHTSTPDRQQVVQSLAAALHAEASVRAVNCVAAADDVQYSCHALRVALKAFQSMQAAMGTLTEDAQAHLVAALQLLAFVRQQLASAGDTAAALAQPDTLPLDVDDGSSASQPLAALASVQSADSW